LQESVLRPLGMVHSSFVWQANFSKTLLPGHTSSRAVESPEHFRHPLASSTLYTTLDDYARFVSKLLRAKPGSPFAMEEMKQVDVRPDLDLAWSLGLAIENSSPTSYFHWGANPGFQSFFLCQPRTGRAVLFFTDSDNGLDLADSMVNQAVPGSHPSLRFPLLHPKD
jgi:CubicO group peptidase (beta-lactamase class C family)